MVTKPRSKSIAPQKIEAAFLSKDDVKVLREIAQAYKSRRLNMESIARTPRRIAYSEWSPDHYVARLVEDTDLPGLTGDDGATGTGSGSHPIPGRGSCWIYRIIYEGNTPLLVKAFESAQEVYNISKSNIADQIYFDILRDKFGRWIAVISSPERIWVRVTNRFTADGIGYYDWVECSVQLGFPVKTNGRVGLYEEFTSAIEVNGGNRAIELTQTVVEIHRMDIVEVPGTGTGTGSGPNGGATHLFDDSIPPIPANIVAL